LLFLAPEDIAMPAPHTDRSVKRTGQIDDNQDDLGHDVADTEKSESRRHPQTSDHQDGERESLSGDAIHDGAQH
jgi:hypothetical protein